MKKILCRLLSTTAVAAALCVSSLPAFSQETAPLYIKLANAPGAVKAALYAPTNGVVPHVAVIVSHRTSNYLSHIATTELPKRGFMVLGMNPRSDNNEALVAFENNALDMKAAVQFLRGQPGITKVLLLGHSGGGPASAFYEAVAENGVAYCQGPRKLVQCSNTLAGLPKVDGIMLADAHPGIGINAVRTLNPAVQQESNPAHGYERRLDPFNVSNGYRPSGPSTYSEQFKREYFEAQSRRMNALIDEAQRRLKLVDSGKSLLTDDEPFIVYKADSAHLRQLDLSIDHTTAQPEKLLKNDGTVSVQIVESVRPPAPELKQLNATLNSGTFFLTARSFLSGRAVRSRDSMVDIDYCTSNNSTRCALESTSVPLLVAAMGAHYFIRDGEILYQNAKSTDKDFVVIEGATHGLGECTACELVPGQYANATKNLFDYMAAWINARY